ncbi:MULTISPECIES: TetR/AcrR family transcriptional regulator [unclassified Actinopolyspora]|uniref:TetR/AcrR family transcriptional regulator n=1 Tax=unclassified Actinopolyspora TaxID=2639451 RepID=UPI0013F6867A|nr:MULTISPECIES: TetR/AcrR family transcriptional regulator [unclassified Actinopolyspora]NHD18168.1 TetR/AcrR family transcriptional regulator [Actinopolyspora sp. BKK2]NHE77155.1 TetR/AcrR family transcriptional regulator [Actinopolyspora sp. BKK1]
MAGPTGNRRQHTGERILDTAARLFYENGIHATGVNTIAERAEVTKVTLYSHFGSKDGLVTEYLRARDHAWRSTLSRFVENRATPEQRLSGIFDAYEQWTVTDRFRGCGFVNATVELTEPLHPAREVIEEHKEGVRRELQDIAETAGCADAAAVAEEWFLLLEGAVVRCTLRHDVLPLHRAHEAALRLLTPPRATG